MTRAHFPVLISWQEPKMRNGERRKVSVPWAFIAPHARQARANHGQTLERLAERGGLSFCEMLAVVEDRNWCADPHAETKVMALLDQWNRLTEVAAMIQAQIGADDDA